MPITESRPSPSPDDAPQLSHGNAVVLLCGYYNPAHIGYLRAAEELVSRGMEYIWLCPLDSTPESRDMSTVLGTEISSALGRRIGCCLSGKSSIRGILGWCKKTYPMLKFKTAKIELTEDADLEILFSGQASSGRSGVIMLPKYVPVHRDDVVARIRAGSDEARNFTASVWEYIQKKRLYRR